MGKILLWVLLGLLAYAVYRFVIISKRRQERSKPTPRDPNIPEVMQQCAHCGVMMPQSDALAGIRDTSKHYCSVEHQRAAESDR